jgi:putative tricarboxylic transport membrane protein
VIEAIVSGLLQVLTFPALGLLFIAVPIGLLSGATPGLGGTVGLALIIPFTYGMSPIAGFAFLLGMHAVVQTSGAIPAILFNTPGTGPAAASCLDGFPMAQQGKAGRAIGAHVTASVVGGLVGAVGMGLLIPIIRPFILLFSPSEFFMLALLGITFIALVSGSSLLKGLIVGGLGLMMAFVGMDPQTGVLRFTYGQLALYDGVPLVCMVVGLFGGAQALTLIAGGGKTTQGRTAVRNDVMEGVKDIVRNWWLTLRASIVGFLVGALPGLGGEAAAWITYGHAVQSSKHPESFGKGNIEGVIAPGASTHAKEAGSLIHTVAFGIPSGSAMAILLGAFLILGLEPGPVMLRDHLDVVWAMFWILIIANVIGSVGLLLSARYLSQFTTLRASIMVPFILGIVMLGSYLVNNRLDDLFITLVFSLMGFVMEKYDWPRAPLVLALVLGPIAEKNLNISMNLWGPTFIFRPIAFAILLLVIASVLYPVWNGLRKRQARVAAAGGAAV